MGRARGMTMAAPDRASTPRRNARTWTPLRLREQLEAFLADFPDSRGWPRAADFEAAGRADLRHAIKFHGGATYWAEQMGRELEPRQERSTYLDSDALADARALIAALGGVPGSPRCRTLGYSRLAGYFLRHGGREQALAHLGVDPRMPLRRPSVYDTDKLAQAEADKDAWALGEVKRLIADHGDLPGTRALAELGHTRLSNYLRTRGGVAAFRTRHGL